MSERDAAQWLSQHSEEVLEPDLPIIDAHHHLWGRPGNRYLIDDYLAEARTGHNIEASVFVECGAFYRKTGPELMAPVGQVEFANGVAAMAAIANAINNAIGRRLTELPMSPPKVLAALDS